MTNASIIRSLVGSQDSFEIDYCKTNGEKHTYHITDVSFSETYGNNYISAYCTGMCTYLTFKIDRINAIRHAWIEIFNKEVTAPKSGIYVFACRGDNHLEFEMYRMYKGERLWKYFENEYAHMNGWFEVDPLAYYFVEFYPEENQWQPFDSFSEEDSCNNYEIVAYRKDENDVHYALRLYSLWPEDDFIFPKHGIYDEDFWHETVFLASCKFHIYTEENHGRHWELYDKIYWCPVKLSSPICCNKECL